MILYRNGNEYLYVYYENGFEVKQLPCSVRLTLPNVKTLKMDTADETQ